MMDTALVGKGEKMSDYIKKEDAKKAATRAILEHTDWNYEIDSVPSADVAPVRHGHWFIKDGIIDCSVCNNSGWSATPYESLVRHFNYCPNCGARMDGGND